MSEFSYASAELDSLAEARNYYGWIVDEFAPHLGRRIVEVGAGIGTFAEHMLERMPASDFLLVEPAQNNFPVLQERFRESPRVRVQPGYFGAEMPEASADSVVAVNVMEHIPDDDDFLRNAHRCLAPGGKLLLFVPALPQIFGTLDEEFEHFRRYRRPQLTAQLRAAGFDPLRVKYVNMPGVFAWWLSGKVLRRRTVTARDARIYDRWVIPWVRGLERHWSPPFGQSLLAVAVR